MPSADELIGQHVVANLLTAIQAAAPEADLTALRAAGERIGPLALRERADLLRDALLTDLPGDYDTLERTIRHAREHAPQFTGWLIWPVTGAVATRAVQDGGTDAFDRAMALLADLTGRLTAEFAIRTLLRHDLDRALDIAGGWTTSADTDVRRLASEGTRPYLPWAARVPGILARPGATMPILDALYRDESEYVRRSVANHLNDLSRDHPDLVVDTAGRWLADPGPETARLVRHSLRTLIKRGHPAALGLLGFTPATVRVDGPHLDRATVPFGGSVRFRATVHNTGPEPAKLAIDYIVHHRKANGTQTGKTFKLTTRVLAPDEKIEVVREHSFRPITTRRYHPGPHAIALQVNGVESPRAAFDLGDT
ncbi:DNA alkylation repair protein [Actinoplanes sichuanensis]|uniref:DNA alkylation repair protein n=1 Tax=Actinoplanes sichuanensis TaxID=512349 RepID=A0ABW4A948_9ACTN|nr:DNA alkylation repair protein [Actinoplanes sichuanensis]BEL06547.1 DNA alkylation repair protein [Actinoplanes sichuanensis]